MQRHLPNELTVETIKQPHRSYPQNPIIASALYKTGFLESWGTGVSRMMEVCKAAGVSEPEYGTDGLFVWITFKRPIASASSANERERNDDQKSGQNIVKWPNKWPEKWPEKARQILEAIEGNKTISIA